MCNEQLRRASYNERDRRLSWSALTTEQFAKAASASTQSPASHTTKAAQTTCAVLKSTKALSKLLFLAHGPVESKEMSRFGSACLSSHSRMVCQQQVCTSVESSTLPPCARMLDKRRVQKSLHSSANAVTRIASASIAKRPHEAKVGSEIASRQQLGSRSPFLLARTRLRLIDRSNVWCLPSWHSWHRVQKVPNLQGFRPSFWCHPSIKHG